MGFITTVNNPDWKRWWEHVSNNKPNFHWKCLEYLKTIFNAIATFACDFINYNMIFENCRIEQLDTSTLLRAIRAYKAFHTTVLDAQAKLSPITEGTHYLHIPTPPRTPSSQYLMIKMSACGKQHLRFTKPKD